MAEPIFGEAGVMSQDEAARQLGVSVRNLWDRIANNEIWAKKDGRRVIVDRRSVMTYLQNLPDVAEATR